MAYQLAKFQASLVACKGSLMPGANPYFRRNVTYPAKISVDLC